MLESLFHWDVSSVLVGILITIGYGALALGDFKIAKGCVVLATVESAGGIIMWGINTPQTTPIRLLIVAVGFALVGIFAVEALRYVDRKQDAAQVSKENTSTTLEQPTFREKVERVTIEMGGIPMTNDIDTLRKQKVMPLDLNGYYPVIAYVEGNKLYADVTVYGGSGKPPIEIKHNEFAVRPLNWDKNSNQKALEIVNEKQEPVFQMIYKSETHLVINGIFPFTGGVMFVNEKGMLHNPIPPVKFSIKRIFKYPSLEYPGELE